MSNKATPLMHKMVWTFIYFFYSTKQTLVHVTGFESKIHQLEVEKKKMCDEFDVQRAKMKELFLQKEGRGFYPDIKIAVTDICF